MKNKHQVSIAFAILAAVLYAISAPASKLLLKEIPSTMMAALLYLGAGIGMLILSIFRKLSKSSIPELHLTKKDLPYIVGMVVLDIAAPIFLLLGLSMTTASNVSLLNNFEIVVTAIIAMFVFKEIIGKRLWIAIALITLSSILLSVEDMNSFSFSFGSLFVLLASICWGFENNFTRMLSHKDPLEIVVVKGFCSGLGSLAIALAMGEHTNNFGYILLTLMLGFAAYGLSIYFYVYAQRTLGATKTSAYYAIAPFIGAALSVMFLKDNLTGVFYIALIIMMIGAYLASKPKLN